MRWDRTGFPASVGRACVAAFVTAASLVVLACAARSTSAAQGHVYSFELAGQGSGAVSDPVGLAVDNSGGLSAHDVYVGDRDSHRVVKFDRQGNFILMFGRGVDRTTGEDVCMAASGDECGPGYLGPGSLSQPDYIAVDPLGGDVYVGDGGRQEVAKYDSSGNPLTEWGSSGRIALNVAGVAVEPDGTLVVLSFDFTVQPTRLWLREYSQAGTPGPETSRAESYSFGLAVDSAGNRYTGGGDRDILRVTPLGEPAGVLSQPAQNRGFAVDQADDSVYVNDWGGTISRFLPACFVSCQQPTENFGSGYLDLAFGRRTVAVDSASKAVYVVAHRPASWAHVDVFARAGTVPAATTGPSTTDGRRGVTLEGDVDSAASGPVEKCRFEYVDRPTHQVDGFARARSVPCATPTPFTGFHHVFATFTDVEGGETYMYRVVASGPGGRGTGKEAAVDMGTLTEAQTGPVRGAGASGGTLTGLIDPDPAGDALGCFFEYVDEGRFRESGYTAAVQKECSPAPPYEQPREVSTVLSGLTEETAYHYRLHAWDLNGLWTGEDRVFSTGVSQASPPDEEPPAKRRRHRRKRKHRRVRCSKRACTQVLSASRRPRTWVSPRFPKRYGWLFSLYKKGKSLAHTRPSADGCASTFKGRGMIATLNGCRRRFRLTYIGTGSFKVRWRVFEFCRCAKNGRREPRRAARFYSTGRPASLIPGRQGHRPTAARPGASARRGRAGHGTPPP